MCLKAVRNPTARIAQPSAPDGVTVIGIAAMCVATAHRLPIPAGVMALPEVSRDVATRGFSEQSSDVPE
jgi:hypothetical protein